MGVETRIKAPKSGTKIPEGVYVPYRTSLWIFSHFSSSSSKGATSSWKGSMATRWKCRRGGKRESSEIGAPQKLPQAGAQKELKFK
jgi:hypothetical protein